MKKQTKIKITALMAYIIISALFIGLGCHNAVWVLSGLFLAFVCFFKVNYISYICTKRK